MIRISFKVDLKYRSKIIGYKGDTMKMIKQELGCRFKFSINDGINNGINDIILIISTSSSNIDSAVKNIPKLTKIWSYHRQ